MQEFKPLHSRSISSMWHVNCIVSLTGLQRRSQTHWFKLTQIHWVSSSYMRGGQMLSEQMPKKKFELRKLRQELAKHASKYPLVPSPEQ